MRRETIARADAIERGNQVEIVRCINRSGLDSL
jgi:hypothetical protein